ncbi:hypothetical protein HYALB_00000713 [Hymenoscyphus albidus]|uniref:Uncharacterized protein n=1 Tax=Hymenoscyphus albidus TaxID=595503 RepID=A0A9N9PX27_9HELO|nr:hypothetical protein HYALB_00000713 [Hymenoscyphus albidus]
MRLRSGVVVDVQKPRPLQRACWQCRTAQERTNPKKSIYECDPRCIVANFEQRKIPEKVLTSFPKIVGLGTSEFILPASLGIYLKIQKQYTSGEDFPIRFFDPSLIWLDPQRPPPYYAAIAYIRKYRASLVEWGNWYEPRTLIIMGEFLAWQETRIKEAVKCQRHLTEEVLILASVFRILAYSHELVQVWFNLGDAEEFQFEGMFNSIPKSITFPGEDPVISISTCEEPPTDSEESVDISMLLSTIMQQLQTMILRRKPSDWPIIIAVLSILKLSENSLSCGLRYFSPFENAPRFEHALNSLCVLFDCIDGRHPLSEEWSASHYKSLVGTNSLAFSWCELLRDLAVDNDDVWDHGQLIDKIDSFISNA